MERDMINNHHRAFLLLFITIKMLAFSSCVHKNYQAIPKSSHQIIHTIYSMKEIEPFLPTADLVIFDIDNTLLEAKNHHYCHVNLYYDLLEEGIKKGHTEDDIVNVISPLWEALQKNCLVAPTEDFLPDLVRSLQKNKKVMALTSRSKDIADETIAQLKSIGLDFTESARQLGDLKSFNNDGLFYKNGIIFTSEKIAKGPSLKKYLSLGTSFPDHLLFVDDRYNNIVSVTKTLEENQLKIDAFFYPRVSRELPLWNKALARKQFENKHGKIKFK